MYQTTFSITRTCGGDPLGIRTSYSGGSVLPAHAGVILFGKTNGFKQIRITRTCGGDPRHICVGDFQVQYYPHMRG